MEIFDGFSKNVGEGLLSFAIYLIAFFALFLIVKYVAAAKGFNFRLAHPDTPFISKNFKIDFSYFLLNKIVTELGLNLIVALLTIYVMDRFFPYQFLAAYAEPLPFWAQVGIGLILADAAFFFPHWFSHKFLWRFHSIHHSAEELSWLTAVRLHPVDQIPFAIGSAVILYVFGFEGQSILTAISIHSAYNLFVHANLSLDFPKPLCYVLGSPNYHRWHHAAEKEAIDKNFATMFPIFDLIFGSYYYPHGRLPEQYGLYGKKENAAFPKTFGKQLIYPFKRKKKKDGGQ